jgi:Cytochrome C'
MSGRGRRSLVTALVAIATMSGATGLAKEAKAPQRARPPKWSADVLDAFFADAREKLEGERADYTRQATAPVAGRSANTSQPLAQAASGVGWSQIIDADTIETEIKRLAQSVAADVTTPGAFKGGAYKSCRRTFSLLAVLFAVAADYDDEVRWRDIAPGLRAQFARAGHNCKTGTDQTYREASERKQDLSDLVGGTRPQVPAADRKVENWVEASDRPPLMQRLNVAHQDRLTKWLANEREFAAHKSDVRHEAQLVAMLGDVIGREGFEYWDDETYALYAKELRQSASEIAVSAEQGNYQQAQAALSRATKACSDCHDGYRG